MTDDPPTPIDPDLLVRLRETYPGAELVEFGDSRALCDELIGLVRSGAKTATCGALRDYEAGGEPMPAVGRRDIVVDWDGRPVMIVETTDLFTCRFDEVPREFAEAEGEGGFDGWREGHIRYFGRNGGWSPDMMLLCERFRPITDLEGDPR